MSWSEISQQFQPTQQLGMLTSRQTSVSSQRSKRKGISLSKEHDQKEIGKSPSFIKLTQKNKKPVLVQKRQIKLLLKIKSPQKQAQDIQDKENNQLIINVKPKGEKAYMDSISTEGAVLSGIKGKQFGKFPLKRGARKERGGTKSGCPSIQLF